MGSDPGSAIYHLWKVTMWTSFPQLRQGEEEVLTAQSCLTLCDPMDHSLPGSSVHGILQARKLEWVVISFLGHVPDPGNEPTSLTSSALAGGFFTSSVL